MSNGSGDACSILCGGCCLVLFSGLGTWCNTQPLGANGCGNRNRNAGCCGSCCNDSFDEDAFDAEVKKDMEKTRDPNAPTTNAQQLAPTEGMTVESPTTSS